eukprot:jgi/Mesvir1/17894/Mv12964-RA.1
MAEQVLYIAVATNVPLGMSSSIQFATVEPDRTARCAEPGLPAGESLRILAGGSLAISPMGLGTWAWGNRLLWNYSINMDPELQRVFNLCVARGINFFDTGDSYGTGELNARAETLLGTFLAQYPGSARTRDNVHIATKIASYPWRLTRESVLAACRESKVRVGGRLDMAQIHWSTANYAPWQERALWKGLAAAYQLGLVRGVGASNYGPKQLRRLHAYLASEGVPLASNQVQYSLLSRDPSHVKETCDELGVTMIAYSPLALGLLTGKYSVDSALPTGPRGFLFRSVLPSMAPLLGVMGEIATARGKSVPQVAVNWCLTKGLVPIPGARDVRQAEENLGALGWRLSDAEVVELEVAAAKAKQVTQNIFQTQ